MSQATFSERPYVNSNLFSGHYLDEGVTECEEWDCDEAASAAMADLRARNDLERSHVEGSDEDALLANWIEDVLEILGFGTHEEVPLPGGGGFVDELLFETSSVCREAPDVLLDTEETTDVFERAVGILEADQWDAEFTEQRSDWNPSHRVTHYLEKTPRNIQWGILTNGRKWRLYGTNDYETQTYYEVDLPELLERGDLEAFKYFYVFFRPAAFRESGGTTFLDEVYSESETASQELGETLQDNVFTALRVLGKGFVETNDDLDIDPDDEEALDELKDQSLVFLYRLMFVLYAEARGLIHPEGKSAQDEYDQNFSLDELRLEIHDTIGEVDEGFEDEFSDYSTTMWRRLEDLFRLIDQGEADLGIPPYNGGLFDHEEHDFLTDHEVSNQYLAEVIYRLSTMQNDEGRYVLADYADLDTRHLGSVYEGLLEHQFRIAPEQFAAVSEDGSQVWKPATEVSVADAVETVPEGGLYVVNDEGERKATGAYYTPDYVVTYIVEETVGPLVEEIREDLIDQGFARGTTEYSDAFFQRVTDLRILDPAMGSGHFLRKAVGYLSEQVMAEVRETETERGVPLDEQHVRREIAKECIYGVDLNGMAVELGKLSMWLETLAADRPLAFLDHHFKQGNSLVGSDIGDVLASDEGSEGDGRVTLRESFDHTRTRALKHVMERFQDLLAIDDETLADMMEMERVYEEGRDDPLYRRLIAMADVHTARAFGLDLPEDVDERMAEALRDDTWAEIESRDWYRSARAMAAEESFFHWELEFPVVFYSEEGTRRPDAGFDAVIGNPPWVATAGRAQISATMDRPLRSYLETDLSATEGQFDLYVAFYETFIALSGEGKTGIIVPDALLTREQNSPIRKYILDTVAISRILTVGMVFDGVENGAAILITGGQNDAIGCADVRNCSDVDDVEYTTIPPGVFRDEHEYRFSIYLDETTRAVLSTIESCPSLSDRIEISRGEEISKRAEHLSNEPQANYREIIPGGAVLRYGLSDRETRYIPEDDVRKDSRDYESPKLIFRQTSDRLVGTYDDQSRITIKSAYNIHTPDMADWQTKQLLGVLNSTLLQYYHDRKHAAYRAVFPQINQSTFESFPVPNGLDSVALAALVETRLVVTSRRTNRNLSLHEYLGHYGAGPTLPEVGHFLPVASSILDATVEEYENLRMGRVDTTRDGSEITIHATARYKPEDEDAYETDRWGYTETEPMPAMRLTDLTETEADLVEAFVPVAVEKADGFAGFRETATKTNSLVDRLKAITLPDPDDVAEDLQRYRAAVERAEELDEKIQRTDDLIDEIVYELYGLTDEEIEIVEDAVGDD